MGVGFLDKSSLRSRKLQVVFAGGYQHPFELVKWYDDQGKVTSGFGHIY